MLDIVSGVIFLLIVRRIAWCLVLVEGLEPNDAFPVGARFK